MILEVVCVVIVAYSHQHNGISNSHNNNAFKFAWRFMPTLVAVLYTLLWAPISKDVMRTEPWAMLCLPGGSKASLSLLRGDTVWWKELTHALKNRKKPGGIRWAVIVSMASSMIASVILNPLSSGIFDVADISVVEQRSFSTIALPSSSISLSHIDDITYFRAITSLVFNVSTLTWITDSYVVMPFWPSDLNDTAFGAQPLTNPQTWSGTTDFFKLELDCSTLSLATSTQKNTILLETDDGCSFPFKDYSNSTGGGIWDQFNVRSYVRRGVEC
jgi:Protein of unknown function (DUF3433)